MRFFSREKGKTAFSKKDPRRVAISPFSRGKIHISQGVENRGSLISVPLALRVKSTSIRGVPKSDFSGNQKRGDEGGGEEGRSGARMHRA